MEKMGTLKKRGPKNSKSPKGDQRGSSAKLYIFNQLCFWFCDIGPLQYLSRVEYLALRCS